MPVNPHHHRCAMCGANVECHGEFERNCDGWPDVVCREYMDGNRGDFRCQECIEQHAIRTVRDMLENV